MALTRTKFILPEDSIPRAWYNISADLPTPAPAPLHPGTLQPLGPADLAPLFPMELIKQVVSPDREIEIPDPVRQAYALYRPSPLFRAHRLEAALGTPGSHLLQVRGRTARPAATSPTRRSPRRSTTGRRASTRLTTETGAGQWGSALAFAGAMFGLEVKVYMVRACYDQKPYRRILMETYGAEVVASPSMATQYGRAVLAETPDTPGSLGIAISEAVEDAVTHEGSKYSLGSVLRLRPPAPDGHRPGGDGADGHGRRGTRHHRRLRRRRLELRWTDLSLHRPEATRRGRVPRHRRRAGGRPEPDSRRLRLRLRRHRARWRPWSRCTPWATTSCPTPSTPAACATTACRPLVSLLKEQGVIEARAVHQRRTFEAGRHLRAGRGHPAGARSRPTPSASSSTRPSAPSEEGTSAGHPLQPVRSRPLRPGRLRALPRGHARGLRAARRAHPATPWRPCPRS